MLPPEYPNHIHLAFDDHHLVANSGLILLITLDHHPCLGELIDHHVDLGHVHSRANAGSKMLSLVASALAGGDCINDVDVLRTGGTATAIDSIIGAPNTSMCQFREVLQQLLDLIQGLGRRIPTHRFLQTVPQPADRRQKSSQPDRYAAGIAPSGREAYPTTNNAY